jgi:CheY-like chemotaxis protein
MSKETESTLPTPSDAMPPDFMETVRDLLEHLYDLPFLQQHPLARHAAMTSRHNDDTPTQGLRKAMLGAVESLKPPAGHAAGSQLARAYGVTYLHYVDGMTVHEASHQLGISLRQAYRDLQRGVDSVASQLWERLQVVDTTELQVEAQPTPNAVTSEVDRLQPRAEPTDFALLCANAVRAISPLAAQKSVAVSFEPPPTSVTVSTDRSVAQQILVHVLSGIVQQGEPEVLEVLLENGLHTATSVDMRCSGLRQRLDTTLVNDVAQHLATKLGWTMNVISTESGDQIVRLTLPGSSRLLLVIDDNEALADLLDRYLDGMDYRIVAATDPIDGLRLCQEIRPQAVLLDVMMPDIDGWELLQRIRNNPRTVDIPVIICTVFNDAELAYSLGASRFLPKPVVREDFLDILQSLHLNA